MRLKCAFIIFLGIGSTAVTVSAYPITPRPLRVLIEESEFIILAHVIEIKEIKTKHRKAIYESTVAVLKIQEVLQGSIKESIISVPYPSDFICPAPPHFEKGTYVLVFLNKKEEYRVHALSYGVKTVNVEQAQVYKSRIAEMQQILKVTDQDQKFMRTADWLVRCAEYSATRYEGIYELSRESNLMSFYDRTNSAPYKYILNEDQNSRLKKALFDTQELTYDELGLVDLLYASNKGQVFSFILAWMKTERNKEYLPWYAGSYMQRLNMYKSSTRTQQLTNDFEKKYYEKDTKPEELRIIFNEFLDEVDNLP